MRKLYVDMDSIRKALGGISRNGFHKMRKSGRFPGHDTTGPGNRKLWSVEGLKGSGLPACKLAVKNLEKVGDDG